MTARPDRGKRRRPRRTLLLHVTHAVWNRRSGDTNTDPCCGEGDIQPCTNHDGMQRRQEDQERDEFCVCCDARCERTLYIEVLKRRKK